MDDIHEHCEVELSPQPSLSELAECDVKGLSPIKVHLYTSLLEFAAPLAVNVTIAGGIGAIRKKVPQEIRLCVHNKYRQEAVAPHTGGDEDNSLIILMYVLLDIAQTRYENPLSVELDITSREEFIIIERKLARLWDRLFQENVRETPEETGEIVQDSMEEDDVVKDDSSKEVVSTVNNAPKLTFDLNKIPEENGVF
ncbi:hypothetical protein AHAS_Ahas16G0207600 [Arachis hypogaea]